MPGLAARAGVAGARGHARRAARLGRRQNGRLLALAAGEFDVFLTGDQNLSFQQRVSELPLAVVVLAAPSTRLVDTLPLMEEVLRLLPQVRPGTLATVGA